MEENMPFIRRGTSQGQAPEFETNNESSKKDWQDHFGPKVGDVTKPPVAKPGQGGKF